MQSPTCAFKTRPGLAVFTVTILLLTLLSCKKDSDDGDQDPPPLKINYAGNFEKSADNVTTTASGTVKGTLDPATREFTYEAKWEDLTSEVADMHFHDAGPVIIGIKNFATTTTGTHNDKATFTSAQVADLAAGKIYVQIHTQQYPGGEVIATLNKGTGNSNPGDGDYEQPPY